MMKSALYRVQWALLGIVMLLPFYAEATHNRAGEIIYRRVNSNPFYYEISIVTYTKTGGESNDADRCDLELFFGDGTSEVVERVNGILGNPCPAGVGSGVKLSGTNTRYNVYTTYHLFPGAGTYQLSMEDPMRNAGVLNIKDSDSVPFYLESYLTIDVTTGGNEAPTLRNPPIDEGCLNQPFYHNPGAVDPEGDSLVYSIVPSRSYGGQPIPGYLYPWQIDSGANNVMTIDSVTGTLSWLSPQQAGEYNVAILIEEYRRNPSNGGVYKVGSIMRDMQINIGVCIGDIDPPVIAANEKVCVTAGKTLSEKILAEDPNGDRIVLSAAGEPLDAGFSGTLDPSNNVEGDGSAVMQFNWSPSCERVRYRPYWMYFKAKEVKVNMTELVDFHSMEIEVNAPAVNIVDVSPQGTSLRVQWTEALCEQASGYAVYRYDDSLGYVAPECVTGVPEQLGYVKIGEVDGLTNTSFLDGNNGKGLIHGQRYCYMIVTLFHDGSKSYPSEEACGLLIRDVPIMNKVSVVVTDSLQGIDSIAWFSPLELNVAVFKPPYRYRLSRSENATGPFEVVYESTASQDPFDLDTSYIDKGLNTLRKQYFYQIEMLSGAEEKSIGMARSASSIFLTSSPADNALELSWEVDVPWKNESFVVYRFLNHLDSSDVYKVLDTVRGLTFTDTRLANGIAYRYFVRSIGAYSAIGLDRTLINASQIHKGIPKDVNPPCSPPDQLIEGDCDLEQTLISWHNPNEFCEDTDDVIAFQIYYAPVLGESLRPVVRIDDPLVTSYQFENNGSIAGCYAVVAIDSFENESPWEQSLCIDNCPFYELPNVFTPGSDGFNDLFQPFPYKFVESIDIIIYNRWGIEVFATKDPDILWDGSDQRSGKALPDGVYYYICQVNEIRLTGIETRELKGDIHLLREGSQQIAP